MSQFFTVLTAAGAAKLTNAMALGIPLKVTHVSVGDGSGAPVPMNDAEGRAALVREVYRGAINSLAPDAANPSWLVAEMVIPSAVGGWTVREIGLHDENGDLIAYGNFPDSYKPLLAEGSAKELAVRMYVETSAASSVQLKIDPAAVLSTRAWVVSQIKLATRIGRPALFFIAQI